MSLLSKFGKLRESRDHEESRAIICCVCSKKVKQDRTSVRVVSEKLSNLVRKYVFSEYTIHNTLHPTAICHTCRSTICAMDKVFIQNKFHPVLVR
jgi:hypothetical protein